MERIPAHKKTCTVCGKRRHNTSGIGVACNGCVEQHQHGDPSADRYEVDDPIHRHTMGHVILKPIRSVALTRCARCSTLTRSIR